MNKEINRIRVVLSELNVKHKWLADKMGKIHQQFPYGVKTKGNLLLKA